MTHDPQADLAKLAVLLARPASQSALAPEQQTLLLLTGAVFTLQQDGSPQSVAALGQAAINCPVSELKPLALQALTQLALQSNQPAIEALFGLAVTDNHTPAQQIILQQQIQSTQPGMQVALYLLSQNLLELERLDPGFEILSQFALSQPDAALKPLLDAALQAQLNNWHRLIACLRQGGEEAYAELVSAFATYSPVERQLVLNLLSQAGSTHNPLGQQTLCQLFIQQDSRAAGEICLKNNWSPTDQTEAALFYFLAEQWEQYSRLDFNHQLLAAAYEKANPALRRRILTLARYSGQTEWLHQLSSASHTRWLKDMGDADWKGIIERLASKPDELWRLAQLAPPTWSRVICLILNNPIWISTHGADAQNLIQLAVQCPQELPQIKPVERWRSPAKHITALALCATIRHLAAGGVDANVHVWGLSPRPQELPGLVGPVAQTRALAFSPDGELLVAANGDNQIRVYRRSDFRLLKTIDGHLGMVRALAFHPDGKTLFSAAFDGTLRAWRFPQGSELKTMGNHEDEIFGLAVNEHGSLLLTAAADNNISVWKWPEGTRIAVLEGHTKPVLGVSIAAHGQLAASFSQDGTLRVWNILSARLMMQTLPLDANPTAVILLPGEQLLAAGTLKGQLGLWSASTGQCYTTINAHSQAVTGLVSTDDGRYLVTSSADGNLALWDLEVFQLTRLPVESSSPAQTEKIQKLLDTATQPIERHWLAFTLALYRNRQRFDVEIGDTQVVLLDEFDIQL